MALYGLQQAAYEFYMLICSLLLALGMVHCEVDHGIFMGEWTSLPDPSVVMPADGGPLVLYVPLHVDDSLGITNSASLYAWFLSSLHVSELWTWALVLSSSTSLFFEIDLIKRFGFLHMFISWSYLTSGTW